MSVFHESLIGVVAYLQLTGILDVCLPAALQLSEGADEQ